MLKSITAGLVCAASGCAITDHTDTTDADEHVATSEQALTPWTAPYMFPSRGLASNHFWRVDEFSEGENILDLDVVRWDSALGRWTARRDDIDQATYDANKTNDKHLSFNLPIYAPVDGRVISCWRNFPDNPMPGVKLDEVTGANGTTRSIFASGNHIVIETDDGNVMLLAHLKSGTVPSSICPFNGTSASTYKPPGWDIPQASFIAEANRPVVRRGDLLGRAGNSGNSSGPHLHVHLKPLITSTDTGPAVSIPWFGAWAQGYGQFTALDDSAWYELDNDAVTATVGNTLFWPSPFLRRGSDTTYNVFDTDSVAVSGVGVLTASRDTAGELRVTTFGVSTDGAVTELSNDTAGAVGAVEVAHPSSTRDVVVGMRSGNGALKLIYWRVGATGLLTRLGSAVDIAITDLDIVKTPAGGTGVITVARSTTGQVKLKSWHTESGGGTIQPASSLNGPYASQVRATTVVDGRAANEVNQLARFQGVVTASIANGNLRLDSFQVGSDKSIQFRDHDIGEAVSSVSIGTVRVSAVRELVVAAVRTTSGSLELRAFEIAINGAIKELGSIDAGAVGSDIEIQSGGLGAVLTAVKLSSGNLKLISWELTAAGELRRLGDYTAGEVTSLSLSDRVIRGGRTYVTTPVRLTDNALKVIAFETNL